MQYKLNNVLVLKGTNSRGTFGYIQADLVNPDPRRRSARANRLYMLDNETVEIYEKFSEVVTDPNILARYKVGKITEVKMVNPASAKKAFEDKTVDFDPLFVDHVQKAVYDLPELWAPIYTQDTVVNGVTHHKGEFRVGDNGEVVPVRQLVMHIMQYPDPDTGTWEWVDEPSQVAQRILERGYRKYQPTAISIEATEVNGIQPAEAPAPQGQAQLTPEQKQAMMQAAMMQMQAQPQGQGQA